MEDLPPELLIKIFSYINEIYLLWDMTSNNPKIQACIDFVKDKNKNKFCLGCYHHNENQEAHYSGCLKIDSD